jgi:hypothetical protein
VAEPDPNGPTLAEQPVEAEVVEQTQTEGIAEPSSSPIDESVEATAEPVTDEPAGARDE